MTWWNWDGWIWLGRATAALVAALVAFSLFVSLLQWLDEIKKHQHYKHLEAREEHLQAQVAKLEADLALAREGGPYRAPAAAEEVAAIQ